MFHASEILNHSSLKTRIKFATIYYQRLDADYSCDSEGLALFINRITNGTPVLSRDGCTSNNGAANMLLTRQNSTSLGIARSTTICHSKYHNDCNNR